MSNYYIAPSGMVVFPPTKEQKEIEELRKTLQDEVSQVRDIKEEMLKELEDIKKMKKEG